VSERSSLFEPKEERRVGLSRLAVDRGVEISSEGRRKVEKEDGTNVGSWRSEEEEEEGGRRGSA